MVQSDITRRSSPGRASRRISVGTDAVTAMKPMPSKKRPTKSWSVSPAKAPSRLAARHTEVPRMTSRRWPNRSAVSAKAMPPSAVIRLMIDSSQPPWRSVAPSSARTEGSAGGILPTWKAATIPAATSSPTIAQSVRLSCFRFAPSVLDTGRDRAVDHEVDAADERRRLAGEEGDRGGHFLRLTHAAHRVLGEEAGIALAAGRALAAPAVAFLVDRTGRDHVHAHALGRHLDRQRLHIRHEGGFDRTIRRRRARHRSEE